MKIYLFSASNIINSQTFLYKKNEYLFWDYRKFFKDEIVKLFKKLITGLGQINPDNKIRESLEMLRSSETFMNRN